MMKTILTGVTALLLLLGSHQSGWGQNFSETFLKQVHDKSKVSIVTINGSMIEALKKGETNKELLAFLNELSFLQIITLPSNAKNFANWYCNKAMEQVKNYAQGEELLRIKDGNRQTLLVAFDKTAGNKAGEIVFINCEDNMLIIINIKGNISIGNLGKLSSLSNSIKKL